MDELGAPYPCDGSDNNSFGGWANNIFSGGLLDELGNPVSPQIIDDGNSPEKVIWNWFDYSLSAIYPKNVFIDHEMKIHAITEVDMTSEAVNEIINQMLNNLPAGCTDDTACNYDSEALNDDGSCDYPLDGCSCSSIDNDNDGICNEIDICPDNWDPYQHDRDQDGLPDACDDNDDDGDGLIDCWDYWYSDGISMSESDILAAIESEGCQDFALENNIFSPFSIGLLNSFPNPFNPSTLITFSLNVSQFIAITIYDTQGQKINDLVNGFYNAGNHEIQWIPNGLISSGLYIVVLKTKHSQLKHKILYLK